MKYLTLIILLNVINYVIILYFSIFNALKNKSLIKMFKNRSKIFYGYFIIFFLYCSNFINTIYYKVTDLVNFCTISPRLIMRLYVSILPCKVVYQLSCKSCCRGAGILLKSVYRVKNIEIKHCQKILDTKPKNNTNFNKFYI